MTRKEFQSLMLSLADVPQDPRHHPVDPDVLTHTALVTYWAGRYGVREITFAATLHDIGKLHTTVVHDDGRITAHGHEKVSVEMIDRMQLNTDKYPIVRYLVANHMKPLDEMRPAKLEKLRDEGRAMTTGSRFKQINAWELLRCLKISDQIGRGREIEMTHLGRVVNTLRIPVENIPEIRDHFVSTMAVRASAMINLFPPL